MAGDQRTEKAERTSRQASVHVAEIRESVHLLVGVDDQAGTFTVDRGGFLPLASRLGLSQDGGARQWGAVRRRSCYQRQFEPNLVKGKEA